MTTNSVAPNPSQVAPQSFDRFSDLPIDLQLNVLSFLGDRDLLAADRVSTVFRGHVAAVSQARCFGGTFIPESLSPQVNLKQFMLNKFPDAIGIDFYQEYFGKVEHILLVPISFVKIAPRPGFKLVFIPEDITITVGPNSPLMLDESTAIDGKKARLIEAPLRAPKGKPREIKVPVTLNNITLLAQRHLKKDLPSAFAGRSIHSSPNVIRQNGDIGVGLSHWSYQQQDSIAISQPYRTQQNGQVGQVETAHAQGLKPVSLTDRIIFHLASYIQSGRTPRYGHTERTSTIVLNNGRFPLQSGVAWNPSGPGPVPGPGFCMELIECFDNLGVGAAVQLQ